MLADATMGDDPRPKALLVPERDQYSSPPDIEQVVGGWQSTTVDILAGSDHFLDAVRPAVGHALGWIGSLVSS